jgi:hypothetical protein
LGSARASYVESSSGFTFRMLYMMVRARIVSATQRPSGSRRLAGTLAWISGESIFPRSPACAAFQRLPASTVMRTSAGVLSPSALSRSKSSEELPPWLLTWMPVFRVKASMAGSWP